MLSNQPEVTQLVRDGAKMELSSRVPTHNHYLVNTGGDLSPMRPGLADTRQSVDVRELRQTDTHPFRLIEVWK